MGRIIDEKTAKKLLKLAKEKAEETFGEENVEIINNLKDSAVEMSGSVKKAIRERINDSDSEIVSEARDFLQGVKEEKYAAADKETVNQYNSDSGKTAVSEGKTQQKGNLEAALDYMEKRRERKKEEERLEMERQRLQQIEEEKQRTEKARKRKVWFKKYGLISAIIILCAGVALFFGAKKLYENYAEGKIKVGISSSDIEGSNYLIIKEQLEANGFTNIETNAHEDLITGWLNSDGDVESIQIGSDSSFAADSLFYPDEKIVITFHTFSSGTAESSDAVLLEGKQRTQAEQNESEEQRELREQLEAYFPKENACKAIIVSFTNEIAFDVYTEDGNSFDPEKLHGYKYFGEFKQAVTDMGTWEAVDLTTWHVEDMYLSCSEYDQATKLKCNITYDGENYVLSDVWYITAAQKNIDSEDPAKTSGWQVISPDSPCAFLTIPENMVTGDAGQNEETEISEDYVTRPYRRWVGDQFNVWNGSHIELTKLIKQNLNDEKSYKHIETTYSEITDQFLLESNKQFLENLGYTYELELFDVVIVTEFSAKNAFNATIKSTAIGVASYNHQTVTLLGFE